MSNSLFRFRIMTYNILYGSHERIGGELVFQPSRADAAREVVRAEAPDVLALTEAAYCDKQGRKIRQDFQAMFGLPFCYVEGAEGDWTSAVLSRFPFTEADRIPLGTNPKGITASALRVKLDGPIRVDIVHPSPDLTEAERVAVFRPLLEPTAEARVVTGDFNALSDEDPYTVEALALEMTPYVADPLALARRMLDRELVAEARRHGLRDALPVDARRHTLPTLLPRPHATQGARIRIDHVLVSDALRVLGGRVVQSEAADRASDHYPVVVDLELRR
jgi:endonuclease/exonuclease/phosphatase family metal-dependent hydrolase